ncbi:LysR substrate-binding domain-containing protein [Streptomyces sp. NPDC002698]|uniref:LysR substrate-binding domain-containing protein n=1 Tax=Streptomyces sp. NPDC002698 TaxID=3364660 RepID=UPI00367EDC46
MAFLSLPEHKPAGIDAREPATVPLVLVVSAAHPLARRGKVALADLAGSPSWTSCRATATARWSTGRSRWRASYAGSHGKCPTSTWGRHWWRDATSLDRTEEGPPTHRSSVTGQPAQPLPTPIARKLWRGISRGCPARSSTLGSPPGG